MSKFSKQKNKGRQILSLSKGFTLVETLVAISIFTVSLLGVMSVLASGVSNTNYAKKKIAATYLAQEGIEYARNVRDTYVLYPAPGRSWADFKNVTPSEITMPLPAGSEFTRTVAMAQENANEVKITSIVTWMQGSGVFTITFSENLFNWVE